MCNIIPGLSTSVSSSCLGNKGAPLVDSGNISASSWLL